MLNRRFNPIGHRPNRLVPTTPPLGPHPQYLWVPPSTPPCPPPNRLPHAIFGSDNWEQPPNHRIHGGHRPNARIFVRTIHTHPKSEIFCRAICEFSTNLPMPSLNSDIRLSPPIKRNKRRTFDEHSIESQEVINRSKSIQLLNTAKNALLESFVLDLNPETAMVIDHVNSLPAKKLIKPKATLEIIDWKLNRVLE